MAAQQQPAADLIALPQGGGAIRGVGEKFSPDLQTGTGNYSIPLEVPAGRRGLQPTENRDSWISQAFRKLGVGSTG